MAGADDGAAWRRYRAPGWLPGGHAQTIWPVLRASLSFADKPGWRRERWDTPDDDFIDVDFIDARRPGARQLVLFHGLEGSSASHYAVAFANWAQAHGWALALPHYASEFVASLALTCFMYIALASSWALFCGLSRYLSLATSAFFGIGAYTSALALEQLPWVQAVALGASIAAGVALLMGVAVLHLRGTYFAVLTFGMTELIRHALSYFEKQVSGTVGRVLTTVPERNTIYLTVLALAVLALATSIVVRRSRFGLALAGIGSDEQRAQTLGVGTRAVKTAGFALTAAFLWAMFSRSPVNDTLALIAYLSTSAVGFVVRPFGALGAGQAMAVA